MPISIGTSPVLRAPVDRVAARVTGCGVKYKPSKKITTADQATPFKLRSVPRTAAQLPDLVGVRFGRMTVIGLAAEHNGRWSCRCDCGVYTLRRTSAVINPENTQDRCEHCRHLAFLRREEHYRVHGFNKDINEF